MRKLSRSGSQILILSTLSAGACVLAVLCGMSAVYSLSGDAGLLEKGAGLDGRNAEAAYRLARVRQLDMSGGEDETERIYFSSLRQNPLLSASWLGLAELYLDSGRGGDAALALDAAQPLIPSSPGLLWESSMIALRLGRTGLALGNLRTVAKADPEKRRRAFDISWRVVGDPALILEKTVPDEILPQYLGYLIETDRLEATYPVWEKIERAGLDGSEAALPYSDYLIRKGKVGDARLVWAGLYPDGGGSLIWDGGFERDTTGKGFDWKLNAVDGVEADYDYRQRSEGERSLRLRFSGEKNIDFRGVTQAVPVEPGSHYALTWDIATSDVTTRSGIMVEVYCKGFRETSENYTGTTDWESGRLEFDAPAGCSLVNVGLRRMKSLRLDNLISGEVWLDNVIMEKTGGATDA